MGEWPIACNDSRRAWFREKKQIHASILVLSIQLVLVRYGPDWMAVAGVYVIIAFMRGLLKILCADPGRNAFILPRYALAGMPKCRNVLTPGWSGLLLDVGVLACSFLIVIVEIP